MFFVYITTNLENGKRYVGLCSKKKKNWESYLGSGTILKKAVQKYGTKAFSREILKEFELREDAVAYEKEYIISNECHLKEDWYNIGIGFATGGFKGKTHTAEHKAYMSRILQGHAVNAKPELLLARLVKHLLQYSTPHI